MANITHKVHIELDPRHPVPEICAVISAVLPYHPGQEKAILRGVAEAIQSRLKKGEDVSGIPESERQ